MGKLPLPKYGICSDPSLNMQPPQWSQVARITCTI